MKKIRRKLNQDLFIKGFLLLLLLYSIVVGFRSIKESLFLEKRDRMNIVFYGQKSVLVSLGFADNVHYISYFNPETKVYVPGGYGEYKVGALGRLAELEDDNEIIRKAFSSIVSADIDVIFSPPDISIYDEDSQNDNLFLPDYSIFDIIFAHKWNTNANIVDRIGIFSSLFSKKRSDFSIVIPVDSDPQKYQGYFYEETFRSEGYDLQIRYSNLKSARILTRILEGEGIRVVDLTPNKESQEKCIIVYEGDDNSETIKYIMRRFGCRRKKGDTEGADLTMILGNVLESGWE